MKKVFIDTGMFIAKEIAADQHHKHGRAIWAEMLDQKNRLYSSEHILDETATLLGRRTTYAFASDWVRDVLDSGIEWLQTDAGVLERSSGLMRKYADQGVSYTDCLSFALMKREKLRWVVGFDGHFEAAGFRLLRPS